MNKMKVCLFHFLNRAIAHSSTAFQLPHDMEDEMLKSGSSLLCGLFVLLTLYVLLTLSGCSVMMAMVGDKEPNFEHMKVGASKEEIDVDFSQPRAKTPRPTLESDAFSRFHLKRIKY